jgi:carbonic anhydrase
VREEACSIISARRREDICPAYLSSPVGDLLQYHNLGKPPRTYERAEVVVGMCMDNRKALRLPENFAYVLRVGGANLRRIEFKVSFAVAIGGVRAICLVGHDECGMVDLRTRREEFVVGLVKNGGWVREAAEEEFDRQAAEFSIDDAATFILTEARRLRERYPGVCVAPLFYKMRDGLLYQVVGVAEARWWNQGDVAGAIRGRSLDPNRGERNAPGLDGSRRVRAISAGPQEPPVTRRTG